MGKASREKGKRGERELASVLKELGWDCRRGVQYSGANGDADVIGLPNIHIGELPAVFWRRNNCDWLVTMRIEDWNEIYKESEVSDERI